MSAETPACGNLRSELLRTNKLFKPSNSKNYFTSTFERAGRFTNNKWLTLLGDRKDMDLIVCEGYKFYKFNFKYNHILTLSKLEKISKYKIEPWENK